MKKSKLFISETYADQVSPSCSLISGLCARLWPGADVHTTARAGAVPSAVPAARAGARVPDPQAHVLHPRQDEEPRDQHAHQGPHQDWHALSVRGFCARATAASLLLAAAALRACCGAAAPPWGRRGDLMMLVL